MKFVSRIVTAAIFCITLAAASLASAQEGLVTLESPFDPDETMNRVENIVSGRGFSIFARIDHAAGAESVGQNLRPTMLLIFGNPQGGTPFMQCAQTIGIDLPVKFLVWEDVSGQVYLSYNDPAYLAGRHDVENCPVVQNMSAALAAIAETATAPQ